MRLIEYIQKMLGRHMYAYMSALCIIACKTSSKSYCGCFQSIQYFILSQRECVCVVVCVERVQKRFPSAAVNVQQFIRRTRHQSAHVSAPWFTRHMIYESVGRDAGSERHVAASWNVSVRASAASSTLFSPLINSQHQRFQNLFSVLCFQWL